MCLGKTNEWDHCQVEKMGCEGCYYYKKCEGKDKKNEQKISECSEDKSNKAN